MKIVLTGKVQSGKTTLLTRLAAAIAAKRGMVATATVAHGQRTQFTVHDDQGRSVVLASTTRQTPIIVGRFYVDVAALESYIEPLMQFGPDDLLYIDEIGRMQLHAAGFQQLVRTYLDAPNDYIGTVSAIYDHPCISEVTHRSDVLVCVVTPENREALYAALQAALANRAVYNELDEKIRRAVLDTARRYLAEGSLISLKKLYKHTIRYIAEGRISQQDGAHFAVDGDHGVHHVVIQNGRYACDCDFFQGRAQFSGRAGECSHIQSVALFRALPVN